jgi:ribonuclease Z
VPQDFKVTLLGTGSPFPDPNRFAAATLVEAGQEKLLFDVGRGATIRLNQIGVPMGAINAVFITHFHSDHTSGLPDLWLTGWIQRYYGT